jgi:hypothetical protein
VTCNGNLHFGRQNSSDASSNQRVHPILGPGKIQGVGGER